MRLFIIGALGAALALSAPTVVHAATDLAAVSSCPQYEGVNTNGKVKFRLVGAAGEYQHDFNKGVRGSWTPWMKIAVTKDRDGNLVIGPTQYATWYLQGDSGALSGTVVQRNGGSVVAINLTCNTAMAKTASK